MAPRPRPVAGHSSCGGGDTQWARAGEAARNSARKHSSFRNTGDSAGLAEPRLFGKQPQLWENTSWLRSLLSISLLLLKSLKTKKKKKKKKKKERNTHFSGEGAVLHVPRAPPAAPSLHSLGEVLGEDTPAFLQLLVLVPVSLLHAHEPAFILRGSERGLQGGEGSHTCKVGPPSACSFLLGCQTRLRTSLPSSTSCFSLKTQTATPRTLQEADLTSLQKDSLTAAPVQTPLNSSLSPLHWLAHHQGG